MTSTTRGALLLIAWRQTRALERHEAARELQLREHSIARYESGGVPRLGTAAQIDRLSGGAIPYDSWLEPVELEDLAAID
jgi:hypothetical protein